MPDDRPACSHCGLATSLHRLTGKPRLYCSDECCGAANRLRRGMKPRSAGSPRQVAGAVAEARPANPTPLANPATADRTYTDDEAEFLVAVERFKRANRRPFPTLSEILGVARSLGYRKARPTTDRPAAVPDPPPSPR